MLFGSLWGWNMYHVAILLTFQESRAYWLFDSGFHVYVWKPLVHWEALFACGSPFLLVLLKQYVACVWNQCNRSVIFALWGISFFWYWNICRYLPIAWPSASGGTFWSFLLFSWRDNEFYVSCCRFLSYHTDSYSIFLITTRLLLFSSCICRLSPPHFLISLLSYTMCRVFFKSHGQKIRLKDMDGKSRIWWQGREAINENPEENNSKLMFKSSLRSFCYSLQKGDLSRILSTSAIKLLQFTVMLWNMALHKSLIHSFIHS